jgi:hypothetical protein
MGHLEIFHQADGMDQRRARDAGRFVIGGSGAPILYLAIDQGRRRGLAGTTYANGLEYDSFHPEDRESYGSGWIVVQFTRSGLPKICVGFYYHKPREKQRALDQANLFLRALQA